MAYVYLHKTKDEGRPFYIGISNAEGEYNRAKNNRRRNSYWNNVVKKHGFTYEILNEGLSWDEAQQYEKKYIKEYKDKGYQLTNMTDGGEGTLGWKRPEKEKRMIADKNSKKKTLTVGGLIHKLSGLPSDTPIYFGEVKKRDEIVWMDELSFIQRKQETADTPHEWDDDGWDDKRVNCLVFIGAKDYRFVTDKMKIETEFDNLQKIQNPDDDEYDKKLDKLVNKLLVFRYIDNIR